MCRLNCWTKVIKPTHHNQSNVFSFETNGEFRIERRSRRLSALVQFSIVFCGVLYFPETRNFISSYHRCFQRCTSHAVPLTKRLFLNGGRSWAIESSVSVPLRHGEGFNDKASALVVGLVVAVV